LVVYGAVGSDVVLLNEFERHALFGQDDLAVSPAWPSDEQWRVFNARAIAAVTETAEPGDLVLLAGGYSQQTVQHALSHLTVCEPFVGYEGITTDFCAFESNAWRHYVYGRTAAHRQTFDGRWLDAVIPNYFDPDDFPYLNDGTGDYLLFVGRVITRKGVQVAVDIAKAAGMRLVVAGPGAEVLGDGFVFDGCAIEGAEYVGAVGFEERARLMAGARALLTPTLYVEPFGGVAVESMMCGTPVIASDFGAFTETVRDGVSGFRFRTLQEGVDAVERVGILDAEEIRDYAIGRYSIDAVAPKFRRWFDHLESLQGDGWAALRDSEAVA
jgi:glycosyltransferase involved in cell wall biosynthesis